MILKDTFNGIDITLDTSPQLFSPKKIDEGTRALLSEASFKPDDKVLDLGCGYGVVGIVAAKLVGHPDQVFLVDSDPVAVDVATRNAAQNNVQSVTVLQSDGFRDFRETGFTLILSNPPYHVDFSVPKHFIEKGFNRLAPGGRMLMVTRRTKWYRKKLEAIFGNVRDHTSGDYTVFESEKRSASYANMKPRRQK